ncbi:MAG: sigma-E factor negative regulatory protein [Zoogloeaceae bacterium]|jgi:sigma-E factor negative regulatory protein RseA|nr:sigma-E factor negative regulatory protein [Zoogloeaceae bacterium]
MSRELSALLDDELEIHEEPALWSSLKANPQLRNRWQEYQLIGDALRAESNLACDITANVMQELANEPVVFAPRAKPAKAWPRTVMALAASAAGVAVVGWLALAPQGNGGNEVIVAEKTQPPPVPAAVLPANQKGMQEYLLAHQTNAPELNFQGGAQHIRTVLVMDNRK